MARYILNEGVIQSFLSSLFNSILKKKQEHIKQVLARDPELKKLYAQLDAATKDLESYLNKQAAEQSPEYNKLRDYLRKNLY